MNIEVLKSVLRSVLQILGVLIALNVKIPFIGQISEILTYLLGQADTIIVLVNSLIGILMTVYGFLIDKDRFNDREVGKLAKAKGLKY